MHSRHLLKVLCGLFFHYIHSIVNGDNTYQSVFMVDHRKREQIIFVKQIRYFLLIICSNGLYDICVHNVFHLDFIVTHQKVFYCYYAFKHSFCIHYIAGIYRLFIIAVFSDIGKSFLYGHTLFQTYILRSHDRPCRIFRIL